MHQKLHKILECLKSTCFTGCRRGVCVSFLSGIKPYELLVSSRLNIMAVMCQIVVVAVMVAVNYFSKLLSSHSCITYQAIAFSYISFYALFLFLYFKIHWRGAHHLRNIIIMQRVSID